MSVGNILLSILLFCILQIASVGGEIYPQGKDRVICFHTAFMGERGTDVAIYDYADYTETMFGYTSKIITPDLKENHNGPGLSKYKTRFGDNVHFFPPDKIYIYVDPREPPWESLAAGPSFPFEAKKLGCHFVYTLKSGRRDSVPRYPEAFNHRYFILFRSMRGLTV